jgi:hypothetical protein
MVMNSDGTPFSRSKPTHNLKRLVISATDSIAIRNIILNNHGNYQHRFGSGWANFKTITDAANAKGGLENDGIVVDYDSIGYTA